MSGTLLLVLAILIACMAVCLVGVRVSFRAALKRQKLARQLSSQLKEARAKLQSSDVMAQWSAGMQLVKDMRQHESALTAVERDMLKSLEEELQKAKNQHQENQAILTSCEEEYNTQFKTQIILESFLNKLSTLRHIFSRRKQIHSPPGHYLMKVADFFFSQKHVDKTFKQILADMRIEHCKALQEGRPWKAWWVTVRGRLAFIKSMNLIWMYELFVSVISMFKGA